MTEDKFINDYSNRMLGVKLSLEKEARVFFEEYFKRVLAFIEDEIRSGRRDISISESIADTLRKHATIAIQKIYTGGSLSNYDQALLLSLLAGRANGRILDVAKLIDSTTNKLIANALKRAIDAVQLPYTSDQLLMRVQQALTPVFKRRTFTLATSETQANVESSIYEMNNYIERQAMVAVFLSDDEHLEQLLRASTVFTYLGLAERLDGTTTDQRMIILGNRRELWQSMEDAKVRPTHAEINGTIINKGEYFIVGGFPMRFPGDPLAPAKETSNCRCVLVYL